MYRLYVTHCNDKNLQSEKEHMNRKVFNEQFNNLLFHLPSKDTCKKCDGFKASLITANNEESRTIEEKKEQQLLKAVIAYEQKSKNKAHAASSEN